MHSPNAVERSELQNRIKTTTNSPPLVETNFFIVVAQVQRNAPRAARFKIIKPWGHGACAQRLPRISRAVPCHANYIVGFSPTY